MSCHIELTRGLFSTVDVEDFARLNAYSWSASGKKSGLFYARTVISGRSISMHRFILDLSDPSIFVDHIDGDGLNNIRSNLRRCTPQQNTCRRRDYRQNSTPRGVWKHRNKWVAYIQHQGKKIYLGSFVSPEQAGAAYEAAAIRLRGEFAVIPPPTNAAYRAAGFVFFGRFHSKNFGPARAPYSPLTLRSV